MVQWYPKETVQVFQTKGSNLMLCTKRILYKLFHVVLKYASKASNTILSLLISIKLFFITRLVYSQYVAHCFI